MPSCGVSVSLGVGLDWNGGMRKVIAEECSESCSDHSEKGLKEGANE